MCCWKNGITWWEFEGIYNKPTLITWNWVPTISLWAQVGKICTKSVFCLSGYIAYILDELQDQFCDLRNNSWARDIFQEMPLSQFWWSVREPFPQLSELAFRILLPLPQYISTRVVFSSSSHKNEGSKLKKGRGWCEISNVKQIWPCGCKVKGRIENIHEIKLPFEVKRYEMHFCGTLHSSNLVVVCCIFLEMNFVIIIVVIISYILKKDHKGGRCRLCEDTKGNHGPNKVEKCCIRWYGPPLIAAFSKWPPSQINCPPLS